jgi:hypothetical protein
MKIEDINSDQSSSTVIMEQHTTVTQQELIDDCTDHKTTPENTIIDSLFAVKTGLLPLQLNPSKWHESFTISDHRPVFTMFSFGRRYLM